MKKLISVTLVTMLALGSTSIQSGDTTKKAFAYAKIALGSASLACSFILPIKCAHNFFTINLGHSERVNTYEIRCITNNQMDVPNVPLSPNIRKGLAHTIEKNTERETKTSERLKGSLVAILPLISLGVLSIQSGRRDLKDLKGNALKQQPSR